MCTTLHGTQEFQRGVFRRRRFRDPLRDQPNHHDLDLDIAAAVVPSIVTETRRDSLV
jgi:hypothetical protein